MSAEFLLATFASFFAGLIDAIVGGGGMILLPTLFATFPAAPPATLLGTNKSASICGTLFSSWQYSRRITLHWRVLLPAALLAMLGSLAGAWTVTALAPSFLRQMLPFILLGVFLYTMMNRNLGTTHAPRYSGRHEIAMACAIGIGIGFYDGFFGPGTGSFFIFLLVRLLGYDFLHASASAKVLNVATNLAALVLFAMKGLIWWHLGLSMAIANISGSFIGSRLALKHGATFVRKIFLLSVSALILKAGYDAFFA
ncbi:MAG: hypothetical protein H6R01_1241 [Burkholderiaceae bacterium]|nr:hypothetical protein [Burkholderiaceae bacterium]